MSADIPLDAPIPVPAVVLIGTLAVWTSAKLDGQPEEQLNRLGKVQHGSMVFVLIPLHADMTRLNCGRKSRLMGCQP